MHEVFEQISSYIRGIWRNRWYAISSAWLVCLLGWIVVYRLPDNYSATARVFVDTQSILGPILKGMVFQPNADQQISLMSKTLITRPNLEKVMRMSDLDVQAKSAGEQEVMIDSLLKRVELSSAGRDNLYFLKFHDKNPQTAKKVVQSLITLFVESSLGDKRKDSNVAKQFIDDKIKAYQEVLISSENALKEFKQKNMGMMPGEDKDFYGRMTEMAGQANQAKLELREMENARDAIKQQLAGEEPIMVPELEDPDQGAGGEAYSDPELAARIQGLERNLDSLRVKFTEQHPDIISTKRVIAELKAQRDREAKEAADAAAARRKEVAAATGKAPSATSILNHSPFFQTLKASLADAEAKVAAMRVRVAEYDGRLESLKAMANQVPQIEADLKQLTRDYEVNKKNYEELLSRQKQIEMSKDLESTGGVDFKIIDPPRVPQHPSDPNRPLLASLVLLGGLAVGMLVGLVLSQVRPTFNDRKSVRDLTGLPLLGTVSMIWTPGQKRVAGKAVAAFGVTLMTLLVCYGLLMGYYLYKLQVVA